MRSKYATTAVCWWSGVGAVVAGFWMLVPWAGVVVAGIALIYHAFAFYPNEQEAKDVRSRSEAD